MTVPRPVLLCLTVLLPTVAALLGGLARAWRSGGQADPWSWALPAALMLALLGQVLARRWWPLLGWAGLGMAGTALLFCMIAAVRVPDPVAALGLLAATLLAGIGSRGVHFPGLRLFGAGLLILAGVLIWRGPAQPLTLQPDRPLLAVVTALPLFWAEAGQGGPVDSPIVAVLRTRFTVRPIDDPAMLATSGARRLLLAQPRALTPAQLVAIDHWVRAGGTALVLADPLLRWPSDLPLGDRRRASPTSLLGPLLAHWGLTIGSADSAEIRHFLPDGRLVTLSGAGEAQPGDIRPVRRRIGKGTVLLVEDADLLDDRLWLADPARPLDPRAWSADTPALVADWLGGAVPGERRWMRDRATVALALRWALLAGTGWAIMGAVLFRRKFLGEANGTKHENGLANRKEND